MIYRVIDIDGTLAQDDGFSVYHSVLAFINSLDLTENRLFFLTARWEADYDLTYRWLNQVLGHSSFELVCRPAFHPFSIASYKRTVIDSIWTKKKPTELHFYDDSLENLGNIKRYRRGSVRVGIYLYQASEGNLRPF